MKARKKILVIDDEKMNIMTLAHFFKNKYEVVVAVDGASGLETAEKHIPDLILLDIIMPDISGFDVLIKLKESEITRNIPVIFITGLDNPDDEAKAFSLGAVDYLIKPFNKTIVTIRVETQLKLIEYARIIEELKKEIQNNN